VKHFAPLELDGQRHHLVKEQMAQGIVPGVEGGGATRNIPPVQSNQKIGEIRKTHQIALWHTRATPRELARLELASKDPAQIFWILAAAAQETNVNIRGGAARGHRLQLRDRKIAGDVKPVGEVLPGARGSRVHFTASTG
jgi:hypothetical protein